MLWNASKNEYIELNDFNFTPPFNTYESYFVTKPLILHFKTVSKLSHTHFINSCFIALIAF